MKWTKTAIVAPGFLQQNILRNNLNDIRRVFDLFDFIFGYEIGKHGLFYRVAKPVFYKKTYIGANYEHRKVTGSIKIKPVTV